MGAATTPRRLLAVGGVCTTTIYQVPHVPAPPDKVLATRACRVVDGMAASAACAFVKLGGAAQVWARTGDDSNGEGIRRDLGAEGIDVDGIRAVPCARSSHAAVLVDGDGQRLVVPFHDDALDPSVEWLPLAAVEGVDFVHCDPRWPEGARVALLEARRLGIPGMLDGDVAPLDVLRQLVPLATHAVFSDAGLRTYTGCADVAEGLRHVAAEHSGHIGATCGAEGYIWLEQGRLHCVAAPSVVVVDTLAAGDVFHGAFALALAEGRPVEAAARFACIAASLKCTRFGGRLGCPTREEVVVAGG
jgi:sulfofructose kinase